MVLVNTETAKIQYIRVNTKKGYIETSYSDVIPAAYFCKTSESYVCFLDTKNEYTFSFDNNAAKENKIWYYAGWSFKAIDIDRQSTNNDPSYLIIRKNKNSNEGDNISYFYYSLEKGLLMFDIYSMYNDSFNSRTYWHTKSDIGFGKMKNDTHFNNDYLLNDKQIMCLVKLNSTKNIYESCIK